MAYTIDSKSIESNLVRVQVPPPAPIQNLTVLPKLFFWGFGFGKTETEFSRPQKGVWGMNAGGLASEKLAAGFYFKIFTIPLFASTSISSLSFKICVANFVPIIQGLFNSLAIIAA